MDRIGQYTITQPIGAGGMGEVWLAYDPRLQRRVAIKVLPARLSTDPEARERLRREAMAAAALDHPFICKVFEIGENADAVFLVMEYVEGETLHQKKLLLPEVIRLGIEIAEALEEAHSRGFVHRDLKPSNVMVTAQGHVKVMDFGLAKRLAAAAVTSEHDATLTSAEAPLTAMGLRVGTPAYMSPEQVAGDVVDTRSDQFSFGILLCEMATGHHPFRRASSGATMAAVLRDPPEITGDLPPGLIVLLRRLLAKASAERYQGMAEVREILARITASDDTAPAGGTFRLPVIGRDLERAELRRRLNEALAGRGSLVLIGGEPGIGKTHLTEELLTEARTRGCVAITGHCYEMEGAPPYVPFVEMLEYGARVLPPLVFRHAIGDSASEVAKLMPELRRIFPDIPTAISLPPEQQRRFLFNAYREFVERSCETTPLVVLFEDLHWADEPTLQLLHHLAPAFGALKILAIGTYRDVELDVTRPFAKVLESLLRGKLAGRISLRRLPVGGVQSMLTALSGQAPPPSLARVIFEETEGNPFFVEEVFRHLVEEGKLFDESGGWRPGLRADDLEVPEGVRLVIGRRLARLGEEARRVLTTAAIIGRTFSLPLLEALESARPDAALEAVEEAERAQLIAGETGGREPRYRFVHELVRQTLADALSLPRRQRLHARVADSIERTYPGTVDAHASAIALHLYQAGAAADPDKTTAYLTMAAKRAREGAAHEEAMAHLENALSLWEGDRSERVADLISQQADVLQSLGRLDESEKSMVRAIEMFRDAGNGKRAAAIGLDLGVFYSWRADHQRAGAVIRGARLDLASADPELDCRLALTQGVHESASGNVIAAAETIEVGLEIARRLGNPGVEAYAAFIEAVFSHHSQQTSRSLAAARRGIIAYRNQGDLWLLSAIEYFELMALVVTGFPAEAARVLPGITGRAERVGHRFAVWICKLYEAWLAAAVGNLADARRAADDSGRQANSLSTALDYWQPYLLGQMAWWRGDLEEAKACIRTAAEREIQDFGSGAVRSTLFAILAQIGDPAALELIERNPTPLPVSGELNRLGVWMSLENTIVGLAALQQEHRIASLYPLAKQRMATGMLYNFGEMLETTAGIAAAAGRNWSCAEAHHRTAIHQADTAPYRLAQPLSRSAYAQMLVDRGAEGDRERARVLLSEALALCESIGMPWHAKQISLRLANL